MSHDYRKYLVGQGVTGAGINFVLNGAIGWMPYRHLAHIPMYGELSVAGDIVVTSLFLPMLVCLIATPLIRNEARSGRLPAAGWLRPGSNRAAHLLGNLLLRAVVLGVLSALLVSPATIWMLHTLGVDGLKFGTFLAFKASFGAALAAVITPVIAAWALEDGLPAPGARSAQCGSLPSQVHQGGQVCEPITDAA